MSDWLSELDIAGLDAEGVERLRQSGLAAAERVAAADVDEIATSAGVPRGVARQLIVRATAAIGAEHQLLQLPRTQQAGLRKKRKARALVLARRIAITVDLLRQARIKVRSTKVDGRKSCGRQLDKLGAALEAVEQDALTSGVSDSYAHDVKAILRDTEDHVGAVVDRKRAIKEHHVRRLKKEARHARRRLEALLGAPTSDIDDLAVSSSG
jgi:hypothetical protein